MIVCEFLVCVQIACNKGKKKSEVQIACSSIIWAEAYAVKIWPSHELCSVTVLGSSIVLNIDYVPWEEGKGRISVINGP